MSIHPFTYFARLVTTLLFIVLIYRETGVWTALGFFLVTVALEVHMWDHILTRKNAKDALEQAMKDFPGQTFMRGDPLRMGAAYEKQESEKRKEKP